MNFNAKQLDVINATEPKILCVAASSSGKTAVLTERIRQLIKKGVAPKDIVAITFTRLAAAEMRQRLEDVATDDMFIGTVHSYALKVCGLNDISMYKAIDAEKYDEILTTAAKLPASKYTPIKHLLIDEAQDLTAIEYYFINKIPTENIFYVGDTRQCQPAGAKVLLRNGVIKNIEDVQVGDSVVWYNSEKAYVSGETINGQSVEKKVLKTAKRKFFGENLITVITENNYQSTYTPNHITYVKLKREETYRHAVYLMCDDTGRFRIGKIPFTSTTNRPGANPWRDKLYKENCSKLWILKVFKTDKEARVLETKLSYKYQIPQTCWQVDKVSWTIEDINYIYEELDTYESAKKCLKEFNRDIRYPLIDKALEKTHRIHFATNAVAEIYAANLIPEVMEVLVYDKKEERRKRYEAIKEIKYTFVKDPIDVYCLEVEGGAYIADNIITHNCIYQFRGGTDKFLVEKFYDPEYTNYFLTQNYRNPPNILEFADSLIASHKKYGPESKTVKQEDGILRNRCTFTEALDAVNDNKTWGTWGILTRTNNEVDAIRAELDKREIDNITFKKADFDNPEQIEEAMRKNAVKVLTIHSMKGQEIPNVIVIGAKTFNAAERNLSYVAATRAKQSLYWCKPIPNLGRRKSITSINRETIENDDSMVEF